MPFTKETIITTLLIVINLIISFQSWQSGELSKNGICAPTFWMSLKRVFVHSNALHLIGNMIVFYYLSSFEKRIGSADYLIGLLIIIFVQVIMVLIFKPACSVGFSGVVLGVLVWSLTSSKVINWDMAGLAALIVIYLQSVAGVPNVSYSGHFYGIIAGALTGLMLNPLLNAKKRNDIQSLQN